MKTLIIYTSQTGFTKNMQNGWQKEYIKMFYCQGGFNYDISDIKYIEPIVSYLLVDKADRF